MSAITIIRNAFLSGYLDSPAECEIDSKPTYAHGASANIVNVPPNAPVPGANGGLNISTELSLFTAATAKHMTTPQKSRTANSICIHSDSFLLRHIKAAAAVAPITSIISPIYTWKPATS